jgi:hypothetical protein
MAAMAKRGKIERFGIGRPKEGTATDRSKNETTGRTERTKGRGGEEKVVLILKRTPPALLTRFRLVDVRHGHDQRMAAPG